MGFVRQPAGCEAFSFLAFKLSAISQRGVTKGNNLAHTQYLSVTLCEGLSLKVTRKD